MCAGFYLHRKIQENVEGRSGKHTLDSWLDRFGSVTLGKFYMALGLGLLFCKEGINKNQLRYTHRRNLAHSKEWWSRRSLLCYHCLMTNR